MAIRRGWITSPHDDDDDDDDDGDGDGDGYVVEGVYK